MNARAISDALTNAIGTPWKDFGRSRSISLSRTPDISRSAIVNPMPAAKPCTATSNIESCVGAFVVPKSAILLVDDFIELVFTRGIYGVIPFQGISLNFAKLSTI